MVADDSLWINEGSLGHEDTVEELSLILGSDLADLADLGAAQRNKRVVDTLDDELVLDILGKSDSAAWLEVDGVALFSSEEVLDLNLFLVLGDDGVDGEMCMDHSHLVSVAL
jgi:hypothetical protein